MRKEDLAEFCKLNLLYDTNLPYSLLTGLDIETGWDLINQQYIGGWNIGPATFKELAAFLNSYSIPYDLYEEGQKYWKSGIQEKIEKIAPGLFSENLHVAVSIIKKGRGDLPCNKPIRCAQSYLNNDDYENLFRLIDQACDLPHQIQTPDLEKVHQFLFDNVDIKNYYPKISLTEAFIAASAPARKIYSICHDNNDDPVFKEYLKLRNRYLFEKKSIKFRSGFISERPEITKGFWAKFTAVSFPDNENIQALHACLSKINRAKKGALHYQSKHLFNNQFGFFNYSIK